MGLNDSHVRIVKFVKAREESRSYRIADERDSALDVSWEIDDAVDDPLRGCLDELCPAVSSVARLYASIYRTTYIDDGVYIR